MDDRPAGPCAGSDAASANTVNGTPVNGSEFPEWNSVNGPFSVPNGTILSYNLNHEQTPGGIKVRWKIRVATGPEAAVWDARQADAIREYLTWARSYAQRQGSSRPKNRSG